MEIAADKQQIAHSLALQLLREDKSVSEVLDALSVLGINEITALEVVANAIPSAHPIEPVNPQKKDGKT